MGEGKNLIEQTPILRSKEQRYPMFGKIKVAINRMLSLSKGEPKVCADGTSEKSDALKPTGVPTPLPPPPSSHIKIPLWWERDRTMTRKKKVWIKEDTALFNRYPREGSSYRVIHRYYQDGFHRVVMGNDDSSMEATNLAKVDGLLHGHSIEFEIGKPHSLIREETLRKGFRKYMKQQFLSGNLPNVSEHPEIAKNVEDKYVAEHIGESPKRVRSITGAWRPVDDNHVPLKISINFVSDSSCLPVQILDEKKMSVLGLSSKKIWFCELSDRNTWFRNTAMQVRALVGFRRVPRKWVPEFMDLRVER